MRGLAAGERFPWQTALGKSATVGGTYDSIGGAISGSTITSDPITSFSFFNIGEAAVCPPIIEVNHTGDDSDATPGDGVCETATGNLICTLRAAIQESNALTSCAPLTITFDLGAPGTHVITPTPVNGALPAITRSVTIQGPTDASVHVTGDFTYRVFEVTTASVVDISNLTIADGDTFTGSGAGLLNSGTGTVTVTSSTFMDSQSSDDAGGGGAVANTGAGITNLTNCTFSGNITSGDGGAIYATAGTINILNTTIAGNAALIFATEPANGGGVANAGGTINVKNTIIAGNFADNNGFDVFGAFTSQGNNLISDGTDSTGFTNGVNGDQVGTFNWPIDPGLDFLNDNGGPTQTFALFAFSPAIEAGNNTGAPATDQRGIARPQGSKVDIGAYELEAFVVNTTADPGEGTCTAAPGGCTLREAIDAANAAGAPRMIAFNIPADDPRHFYYPDNGGPGLGAVTPTTSINDSIAGIDSDYPHSWWSIQLATASGPLPPLTGQVFINGYSQPGASVNTKHLNEGNDAILRIELNGTELSTGYGLDFESGAEGSKTSGLTINHFAQIGIYVNDEGFDTISGNFIGTDVSGTLAQGSTGTGILLDFGANHLVGGEEPAARNLISGHTSGTGLDITGIDNLIEGNYIGTDRNGSVALGNNFGVTIQSCGSGNTIGCLVLDGGNLISGNTNSGVFIEGSTFNAVVGNFIGTDRLGTAAIGNGIGVNLLNAGDNLIGFLPGGPGNVISGNVGDGILIKNNPATSAPMFNIVQGNLIGTSTTGLAAVPNGGAGVELDGSSGNEIGCTEPEEGNVISGNSGEGVEITGGAGNNLVQGNFIGVGLDSTTALGNGGSGVEIYSTALLPSTDNFVGLGSLPEESERNRFASKARTAAASQPDDGKPNRFSSRKQNASRHRSRTSSPRNAGAKVSGAAILFPDLPQTTLAPGANIIANNNEDGVKISSAGDVNNIISQNSIYSNGKLGINLVAATDPASGTQEGVTDNDSGDGDDGPNHLQNFPEISDAAASTQTVTGTLDSSIGGPFTIEFFKNVDCDGSGYGEGKTYFGSTQTNGGNFSFVAPAGTFTVGQIITATATDASGNTSEFSFCFTATPTSAGANLYIEKTDSPDPVTFGNALTYTVTVFNNGPTAATNVEVTDNLPASVTFVSATASQGSCSGTTTVTCNLGTIGNGANASVQIVVTAPNTVGSITNFASVESPDESNDENNTDSEETQVNTCPDTFNLTSTGDAIDAAWGDGHCDTDAGTSGDQCTLRAAIEEANALPACGVITIDATGVNGSISLGTALPMIAHNVNINGPGPSLLTVERGIAATFRIFFIDSFRTVNISGLNIANGLETQGGNVNNQGTTTLTNCLVRGGQATYGGGIYNGSVLTLVNSTVRDNSSDYGGGINSAITLTLTGSTISDNTAAIDGGAVYNGGGGATTMANSTISGNSAVNDGGGIFNDGASSTVTITNVTITNNRADSNDDSSGDGGGIKVLNSAVTRLRNTIVALNFKGPSTRDDVKGTVTSQGHNLIGDETGSSGFGSTGDQVGTGAAPIDPLLGALGNNGGTTLTHALLYNSPAVDAGDDCVFDNSCAVPLDSALTTDQRGAGFARQTNGDLAASAIVDIGAYERQATETRSVPSGDSVQVDLVDVRLNFPCVPIGVCGGAKANGDGAQPKTDAIAPAIVPEDPTASISVIDPASQPTLAGYGVGNAFNPPLPAFDVSTSSTTYDIPLSVCFYLPTITNQSFFEGLKVLHNEGGVMVPVTTSANFSQKTVCGSVDSLSPFVIAHLLTPTASNGSVSGQILDNNGNPVEGAAVRMTGTQNRLTVTDASGNYHFDNVETNGFYTVRPTRANSTFSPTQREFSQQGQTTNAAFSATLANAGLNPLDTTVYFVRQQYVDFLGREPDEAGLNFWVNNIESCGVDAPCREVKRIDTSAAFFLSIEFQQTGYLVYRMYAAAYGDIPGSPVPVSRNEFKPDTAALSNGVVVLKSDWERVLENNKQAFAAAFVQRARFAAAYQSSLTPSEFVDQLFTTAGVTPSASDRTAAISEFGAAVTSADVAARGRALRRVAENGVLAQQEFSQAFVLMEYFGYLQRDANAGQDSDFTGYNFWLDKLNTFGGDFHNAEMVKAFLTSIEYRRRFPR